MGAHAEMKMSKNKKNNIFILISGYWKYVELE